MAEVLLRRVAEVSQNAIAVSREINALRERDTQKMYQFGKASQVALKILKHLYTLPIIDLNKIIEWTGYTPKGAYNLLDKFVAHGILRQQDKHKEYGRQFVYSEYLDVFTHGE